VCLNCGSRLETVPTSELPDADPEVVPVQYVQAERHVHGVAPPALLLGLAVFAVVLASVLFAFGNWLLGVVFALAAAALALLFVGAARQLPAELGTAAYRGDDARAAGLNAQAHALDDRMRGAETELRRVLAAIREQRTRERAAVQPTESLDARDAAALSGERPLSRAS
jgi:uncharacterized membrane protein YedE/YeeE